MYDTEELIREKTEYLKLADGTWRAEFPGKTLNVAVTAPTVERARWDVLRALDARFFAMLCDDLGLSGENRPRPSFAALRQRG